MDRKHQRVTELVMRLGGDETRVADELLPLVYEELRVIAGRMFARQPAGHTLQPTALVNEAWVKMAGPGKSFEGRSHFFSVAARAMRQVLTDHARARRTGRRGHGWHKVAFDDQVCESSRECDLLDLSDALERLADTNQRVARVAELRLFAGLTVDEVATVLGVTARTVQLDWRCCRAWLRHTLEGPKTAGS